LATNFRNPPWPPFDKGGFGGISGEFIHTPIYLFGSGSAGLGRLKPKENKKEEGKVFVLSKKYFGPGFIRLSYYGSGMKVGKVVPTPG
jgi:hypothetical protein